MARYMWLMLMTCLMVVGVGLNRVQSKEMVIEPTQTGLEHIIREYPDLVRVIQAHDDTLSISIQDGCLSHHGYYSHSNTHICVDYEFEEHPITMPSLRVLVQHELIHYLDYTYGKDFYRVLDQECGEPNLVPYTIEMIHRYYDRDNWKAEILAYGYQESDECLIRAMDILAP